MNLNVNIHRAGCRVDDRYALSLSNPYFKFKKFSTLILLVFSSCRS